MSEFPVRAEIGPVAAGSSAASEAAAVILLSLINLGVQHVVVSPGARSQALALAADALARRGLVKLHVRSDERVAGFTALGIAKESELPAVLICTSGTAVANLLPAALEARHSGVPMIILSGDRPIALRGIGSNQTTDQLSFMKPVVRWQRDAPLPVLHEPAPDAAFTPLVSPELYRDLAQQAFLFSQGIDARSQQLHLAGPVQLNVPVAEPLSAPFLPWFSDADLVPTDFFAPPLLDDDDLSYSLFELRSGPRTVVVAGEGAGEAAEDLAHRGHFPLIAEVVSGARFGRELVHGYRKLLADPEFGARIERVVVFGHPTLSRELRDLLSDPAVEVVALRGGGEDLNLNGRTVVVDELELFDDPDSLPWLRSWQQASRELLADLAPPAADSEALASDVPRERLAAMKQELQAVRMPISREIMVDSLWRASWPHDRIMFASSRLVRVADDTVGGKKLRVFANRGLAGIDGTIATAEGIAIASQSETDLGVTRVLIGDLAFLHDVGALQMTPGEAKLRMQLIVGNDRGGTIFQGLELAGHASDESMRRVMLTPQDVDLQKLAEAFSWGYSRVTTRSALDQALSDTSVKCQIIEVPLFEIDGGVPDAA